MSVPNRESWDNLDLSESASDNPKRFGQMLPFSRLRQYKLIDARGKRGKLIDFIIDLSSEGHPPVTHLLFRRTSRSKEVLPWDADIVVNHLTRQIKVKNLEASDPAPKDFLQEKVRLSDISDALVLDLEHRSTVRVNGLLLNEENGILFLFGVDTSLSAILRRLTGGRFSYVPEMMVRDWTRIEYLRGDPQAAKAALPSHKGIAQLAAGEIALLASQLPYMHAAELVTLLPDALAINTLEAMATRRMVQVFEELEDKRALRLLALMAPDLAADLLGALQTETMEDYLRRLPKVQSERIVDLLGFPEDTVGGIMTNDIVFAPMKLSIAEARDKLKQRLKEPDFVYLIFIVDDERKRKQLGVVPLRDLLTCDDNKTLGEIMDTKVPTLASLDSAEEGAFKVIESQLAALPVVGPDGQLMGAVTVDAAVLIAAPKAWGPQAPRIFS